MEDRVGEVQLDQVSLGVLVTAVPRDAVDAAVAACGVVQRRGGGKLPAHVTAYLTMALCLFWQDDYEEVATKVTRPMRASSGTPGLGKTVRPTRRPRTPDMVRKSVRGQGRVLTS
jgi:hypothetical protein